MTKRKALTKTSSTKKKTSKTRTIAAPQRFRAQSTPPNHEDDAPILIDDDVAVDNDPLPSPQYTVSYTVKLDEKIVEEDSNIYQIDGGIKSFVWMIWDRQQASAVKKYCDNKGYSYHRHNVKATINCQGPRKDPETLVTLKGASDWVRVKDLIRLWDSLKKKGITVTVKAN